MTRKRLRIDLCGPRTVIHVTKVYVYFDRTRAKHQFRERRHEGPMFATICEKLGCAWEGLFKGMLHLR